MIISGGEGPISQSTWSPFTLILSHLHGSLLELHVQKYIIVNFIHTYLYMQKYFTYSCCGTSMSSSGMLSSSANKSSFSSPELINLTEGCVENWINLTICSTCEEREREIQCMYNVHTACVIASCKVNNVPTDVWPPDLINKLKIFFTSTFMGVLWSDLLKSGTKRSLL